MHWRDEAIIIGVRRHGEHHAIAEVFARGHGRWRGLVHGGASRRRRAWLQPGNVVRAEWRARTPDQLGTLAPEPAAQHAALALSDPAALATVQALAAELSLCPERQPHPPLYEGAATVLAHLGEPAAFPALLARFELALLAELGYGLDLSRCALTGKKEDLAWVSPKTGRAASREAGAPWAEKLFPLPAFLHAPQAAPPTPGDVADGLRLTAYFLETRLFSPQGRALPEGRRRLPDMLAQRKAPGPEG